MLIKFIFISLYTLSIATSAKVKLSEETVNFIKQEIYPLCDKDKLEKNLKIYPPKCLDKELINEDDLKACLYDIRTFSVLSMCIGYEKKIDEITQKIFKDSRPIFKSKIDEITNEYHDFKKKGLSGSLQLNKIVNLVKNNELESLFDISETESQLKNLKEVQANREKTCRPLINLNEPLSLDHPKDQSDAGWCYAFTASDLVAHVTGIEPSSVYLAQLMNNTFLWKALGFSNGGLINSILELMKEKGICEEKNLSSQHAYLKLKKMMEEVMAFNKAYNELITENEKKFFTTNLCNDSSNLLIASLKNLFPNKDLKLIFDVIKSSTSSHQSFINLTLKLCPIKKPDFLKDLKVTTVSDENKIFSSIDEQLEKGNIVGIHYDSNILEGLQKKSLFFGHASSIIGRRFNKEKGVCEYMIRNSHGTSCMKYNLDYDCFRGNVWISEEHLKYQKSIREVIYLEK